MKCRPLRNSAAPHLGPWGGEWRMAESEPKRVRKLNPVEDDQVIRHGSAVGRIDRVLVRSIRTLSVVQPRGLGVPSSSSASPDLLVAAELYIPTSRAMTNAM